MVKQFEIKFLNSNCYICICLQLLAIQQLWSEFLGAGFPASDILLAPITQNRVMLI